MTLKKKLDKHYEREEKCCLGCKKSSYYNCSIKLSCTATSTATP